MQVVERSFKWTSPKSQTIVTVFIEVLIPPECDLPFFEKFQISSSVWNEYVASLSVHFLILFYVLYSTYQKLVVLFCHRHYESFYSSPTIQTKRFAVLKNFPLLLKPNTQSFTKLQYLKNMHLLVPVMNEVDCECNSLPIINKLSLFSSKLHTTMQIPGLDGLWTFLTKEKNKMLVAQVVQLNDYLRLQTQIGAKNCLMNCPLKILCSKTNMEYAVTRRIICLSS